MEIIVNKDNKIEYRFASDFPNELADIASDALDIMRENPDDTLKCLFALMDELDLMMSEAKQMIDCPTEKFEELIYYLFTLSEE